MKTYTAVFAGIAAATLLGASVAAAQAAPSLGVGLQVSPTLPAGIANATVAYVTLAAGAGPVTVSTIPLSASGSVSALSSCQLRNVNDFSAPLNTNQNILNVVSASSSILLDTPVTIQSGSVATFFLTCNIDPAASGSVTLSMLPSTVTGASGTSNLSGTTVIGSNGIVFPTSGTLTFGPVSSAGGTTGTSVPTAPNTGAGGAMALNLAILAIAGLAAASGAFALRRMRF